LGAAWLRVIGTESWADPSAVTASCPENVATVRYDAWQPALGLAVTAVWIEVTSIANCPGFVTVRTSCAVAPGYKPLTAPLILNRPEGEPAGPCPAC
jgi:hypothetical protein